jgi:iron-sulfur cluster insertion protein
MAYSDKVIDHYENPRNVGSFDKSDKNIGTGMVGAPACGDVMKLQIKVDDGMITVTEAAKTQLNEILLDEPTAKFVRAFISGGGCSGFNYGFTLEENKEEDDFVIDNLIVDSMSMQYFDNATIDFTSDKLKGSQFVITNPNAKTTCGCGSSFSV